MQVSGTVDRGHIRTPQRPRQAELLLITTVNTVCMSYNHTENIHHSYACLTSVAQAHAAYTVSLDTSRAYHHCGYGRRRGLHGVNISSTAGEQPLFIIVAHSGKRLGPDRRPLDEEAYGYGGRVPYPGLDIRPLPESGINDRSKDGGCRICDG